MNNHTTHLRSERGIVLIVVLLLMLVLSGLATGFAVTGQVESQMAANEVNFAGARAAAEAGLNRALVAIFADTTTDWIKGTDGLFDATNASASVNTDNGSLSFLLGTGPFYVDAANRFSYTVQILDDDNPLLYEATLNSTQLGPLFMNEDDSSYTNTNDRVVLRAIGYGPNGTSITLARIIETFDSASTTTTNVPSLLNPALLVNGNFEMNGNITVTGTFGNVHANGNIAKTGASGTVSGDVTTSGTYTGPTITTGGHVTGTGRATINVPDIRAATYESIADYKLGVVSGSAVVQTRATPTSAWVTCTTAACKGTGWTYSGGTWTSGSNPTAATYFVEGNVVIANTTGSTNRAVSVLATGDINVSGVARN